MQQAARAPCDIWSETGPVGRFTMPAVPLKRDDSPSPIVAESPAAVRVQCQGAMGAAAGPCVGQGGPWAGQRVPLAIPVHAVWWAMRVPVMDTRAQAFGGHGSNMCSRICAPVLTAGPFSRTCSALATGAHVCMGPMCAQYKEHQRKFLRRSRQCSSAGVGSYDVGYGLRSMAHMRVAAREMACMRPPAAAGLEGQRVVAVGAFWRQGPCRRAGAHWTSTRQAAAVEGSRMLKHL